MEDSVITLTINKQLVTEISNGLNKFVLKLNSEGFLETQDYEFSILIKYKLADLKALNEKFMVEDVEEKEVEEEEIIHFVEPTLAFKSID